MERKTRFTVSGYLSSQPEPEQRDTYKKLGIKDPLKNKHTVLHRLNVVPNYFDGSSMQGGFGVLERKVVLTHSSTGRLNFSPGMIKGMPGGYGATITAQVLPASPSEARALALSRTRLRHASDGVIAYSGSRSKTL